MSSRGNSLCVVTPSYDHQSFSWDLGGKLMTVGRLSAVFNQTTLGIFMPTYGQHGFRDIQPGSCLKS